MPRAHGRRPQEAIGNRTAFYGETPLAAAGAIEARDVAVLLREAGARPSSARQGQQEIAGTG